MFHCQLPRLSLPALLCICLQLWCAPALAQNEAAMRRSLKLYREGVKSYQGGDYRRAIQQLTAAQQHYGHKNNLYYLSLCHMELRAFRRSYQLYLQHLQLLPAVQRAQKHRRAEQKLRRDPPCEVLVSSTPPGATVTVDDKPAGVTLAGRPLKLILGGGQHRLAVHLPGHDSEYWAALLEFGEQQQRHFRLTPHKATLRITSKVPHTRIRLGDLELGTAPLWRAVPPGRFQLVARAAGHQPTRQLVTLAPGKTHTLHLELSRRDTTAAASQPATPAPRSSPNRLFFNLQLGPATVDYGDPEFTVDVTVEFGVDVGYMWRRGRWGLQLLGSLYYAPSHDLVNGGSSGGFMMVLAGGGARLYATRRLWIEAGVSMGLSVLLGANQESLFFAQPLSDPRTDGPRFRTPSEFVGGIGFESFAVRPRAGVGYVLGSGFTVAVYPFALDFCMPHSQFRDSVSGILRYNATLAVGWQR